MKKIVMAALAALMMTVTAGAAEDSFFDYKQEVGIGVSYQYFKDFNNYEKQYAINVNGKAMKKVAKSVAIGLTLGLDYNPDVDTVAGEDGTEYFFDILPTVTYIVNEKVDVSLMIGYTMGTMDMSYGNYDYTGMAYGLGASYEFAPQWRANIQVINNVGEYKDTSSSWKGDHDIVRTTVGVGYNF